MRHHKVDPMEYNARVDDAIPIEDILKPDPQLRAFLQRLDRSKVKPWLLTNAYVKHARRVLRQLGVEDLFEGLTFCDYAAGVDRGGNGNGSVADGGIEAKESSQKHGLICKPFPEMYAKAMREAGVAEKEKCFFVGKISSKPSIYQILLMKSEGGSSC